MVSLTKTIIFVFVFILLVGTVSAWDWDNVRDYDEETQTMTITNALGLGETIATVKLNTPHNNIVGLGYQKVFEFTINSYGDYESALKEIEYFNARNMEEKEINLDLKYKTTVLKQYPVVVCTSEDNKTETCKEIIEEHEVIEWVDYLSKDMLEGEITIAGFTDVKDGDYVEFIPTWFGERMHEFASWTASLNTDITAYYTMNETSGDTSLDLVNGDSDSWESAPSWYSNGIIDYYAHTSDYRLATDETAGDAAFSIAGWANISGGTYQAMFGTGSSGSADAFYLFVRCNDDEEPHLYVRKDGSAVIDNAECTGDYDLCDGLLRHYALTFDGTDAWTLYINGTDCNLEDGTGASDTNSSNTIKIGGTDGYDGNEWPGGLDEWGIWNRELTSSEIQDNLYNGGSGNTYTADFDNAPTAYLDDPVDYYNWTSNSLALNYSCVDDVLVQNITLYINGTANLTTTNATDSTVNITTTVNFPDGMYEWNATCYDNASQSNTAGLQYFTIDSTVPTINITQPYNSINYHAIGTNLTINFTASDTHLDSCWYSWNSGTTNTSVTCADTNFTSNITSTGNNTIYLYANDTFGNENYNISTWDYNLFENSIDFSLNLTEGTSDTFTINISSDGAETVLANFSYNGTIYSTTKTGDDSEMTFSKTLSPIITGTNELYWIVYYGSTPYNSTKNNQGIQALNLSDCSGGGNIILNFTLKDEETQSVITSPTINSTVEIDVDVSMVNGTTINETYFNKSNTNPVQVCAGANLTDSVLRLDATVRYEATSRESEFYIIQNFSLSNETIPDQITLYDLLTADAQEFKITYKDDNFVRVSDALIKVQRYYIEDGTFKTVEQPITDQDGSTLASLVLGDVIYTFVVQKEGTVLATFDNVLAVCENAATGDCKINLNEPTSALTVDDWTTIEGVSYTLSYDDSTRNVTSIFSVSDGSTADMLLNVTVNDAQSCSTSLTSSSGTLICHIPSTVGNATALGVLSKDGTDIAGIWIPLYSSPSDIYGTSFAVLAILSFLTVIGIGLGGTAMITGIFIILGAIVNGIMLFTKTGGFIGAASTFLWLVIAIIVVLFKANRRNP